MARITKGETYTRAFFMTDSADHLTGKTGLTVAVTLSKAGAAFAAAGGTVTELTSGWYKIALTTTDTNTSGDLAFHCTSAGADATDFMDQVGVANIDSLTLEEALRIILAGAGDGVISGAGTTTVLIKNNDASKTRETVTADGAGNRTAVVRGTLT